VTQPTREEALAHFGKKGMKWGVRTAVPGGSAPISRKQNRQMNKEASQKFYSDKATTLYKEAKKSGDTVLVKTQLPNATYATVVTGKQFAEHLEAGGAMNIRMTEIYARQPKPDSQFVLNDQKIGTYKKQNFRKS
jgi:hypothetical protein